MFFFSGVLDPQELSSAVGLHSIDLFVGSWWEDPSSGRHIDDRTFSWSLEQEWLRWCNEDGLSILGLAIATLPWRNGGKRASIMDYD